MPPRSSAVLPAPPPHPISPPIRSNPTLYRPLPVSWAPPHPGPPGPAALLRPQGKRRPSSPGPRAIVGPATPTPPSTPPHPPASFGGPAELRGPGPCAQRLAVSGLGGEEARTRRREHYPAAGPGQARIYPAASTQRAGLRLGKGWGQKLRAPRAPRDPGKRRGLDLSCQREAGPPLQVPSARIRGRFGGGATSFGFFRRWSSRFGYGRSQELRPDVGGATVSAPFGGSRVDATLGCS